MYTSLAQLIEKKVSEWNAITFGTEEDTYKFLRQALRECAEATIEAVRLKEGSIIQVSNILDFSPETIKECTEEIKDRADAWLAPQETKEETN